MLIRRSIREDVAGRIRDIKSRFPRFQPTLVVIQAGERPDSSLYIRMKAKAAEEVGITFKHITLPVDATCEHVIGVVNRLNLDETVSGILVQLPLGPHITSEQENLVTEAVNPEKDVDGYVLRIHTLDVALNLIQVSCI